MLSKIFNTTSKSKHRVVSAAIQEQKRELGYINSYTILEFFHNDHLVKQDCNEDYHCESNFVYSKQLHVTNSAESVFLVETFEVWNVQICTKPEVTEDVNFFINDLS